MNYFAIGDLHFGHKSILQWSGQYRGGGLLTTPEEHDEWIIERWNSVVTKRDFVYVLGDAAFNAKKLELLRRMRGQKALIRGNHDKQGTETYLKYFTGVYGLYNNFGFWFSHAPIHPQELRGRRNVHGHCHHNFILGPDGLHDDRYINVSVEALLGVPVSIEELQKKFGVTEENQGKVL